MRREAEFAFSFCDFRFSPGNFGFLLRVVLDMSFSGCEMSGGGLGAGMHVFFRKGEDFRRCVESPVGSRKKVFREIYGLSFHVKTWLLLLIVRDPFRDVTG